MKFLLSLKKQNVSFLICLRPFAFFLGIFLLTYSTDTTTIDYKITWYLPLLKIILTYIIPLELFI